MLEGLMQDHPLTLHHIRHRMQTQSGDAQVVSATGTGRSRATHTDLLDRADRLCSALAALGVRQGDRVATFSWNTQEHLEAYLAVPWMGAVLHTVNVRLFDEQLVYVVNHARDRVVLVDHSLVGALARLAPQFTTVEHVVVMGGDPDPGPDADPAALAEGADALPGLVHLEELLAAQQPGFRYPELDERTASGLCYTSGTTGNPKGVLYSHRSHLLHAMGAGMAVGPGMTPDDRVLPVVPMFHANAWGLPYAAALLGADLVMPGRFLQAEPLVRLIEEERVTLAGAVPTIWLDVLKHADAERPDLSSLRLVLCGGSAVPRSLMEAFEERHGMRIVQAWGMTETSPLASVAHPAAEAQGEEHWEQRATAGRPLPLVETRIVDGDGAEQPRDGSATGELEARGPWVCSEYFEDPAGAEKFHDGWLRTGDVASIDPRGVIRISDRAKDVIKSGGEWISSVDLENELMSHPKVAEAAVIARPDERWAERPLACVVCADGDGERPTPQELTEHLRGRVASWWLPDAYAFIDEVPKTSVGKFDKKVLRARLEAGELQEA